ARRLEESAGRGHHGVPPVRRVLFDDTPVAEVRRVADRRGRDQHALRAVQRGLVAGRAQVVRDDHGYLMLRRRERSIVSATAATMTAPLKTSPHARSTPPVP